MSVAIDKALALAASIRLPNLPSVWCNTFTGVLVAALISHADWTEPTIIKLSCALAAATCLYLAGNLFNDWADRNWDTSHRPERALPRGLFTPQTYLTMGICLMLLAWTAAGMASIPALVTSIALTGAIAIYTWLHKHTPWSAIPMALCRALLPILGYLAIQPEPDELLTLIILASPLFIYLIMLSMTARAESKPETKTSWMPRLGLFLPAALFISLLFLTKACSPLAIAIGTFPYLLWVALTLTAYRKPVPRMVSAMLAGIPLVDAMLLLAIFYSTHMSTPLLWIWLPAFILGRLLQRIVPAT